MLLEGLHIPKSNYNNSLLQKFWDRVNYEELENRERTKRGWGECGTHHVSSQSQVVQNVSPIEVQWQTSPAETDLFSLCGLISHFNPPELFFYPP